MQVYHVTDIPAIFLVVYAFCEDIIDDRVGTNRTVWAERMAEGAALFSPNG
jgi:hypothetical protein